MALIQGDDIGFSPFKALKSVGGVGGKLARTAGGVVPGPWGMALKVAGGVLAPGAGGKAPPPPCTFGQKVKRFFGGKPNCM